jgi:hypothetical protein
MENHELTEQATVLYIGGHGRSGSTILAQTLGQIPGFVYVGELWHVWYRGIRDNERCGCGQLFGSCKFWRAVGEEAFGGWENVDVAKMVEFRPHVDRRRYTPHYALAAKTNVRSRKVNTLLEECGPNLERLYRAIQAVSGAGVIVDSSKRFSYAVLLNLLPFADLRVVQLVRDSRAVAYSWGRTKVSPQSWAAGSCPGWVRRKLLACGVLRTICILPFRGWPTCRAFVTRILSAIQLSLLPKPLSESASTAKPTGCTT